MYRFRRTRPRLRASEINRWNRTADQIARNEIDRAKLQHAVRRLMPPNGQPTDWAILKNDSGHDLEVYEPISLGPIIEDLRYTEPLPLLFSTSERPWDPAAVALEPIPQDEYGRVQISGVTLARVGAAQDITAPTATTISGVYTYYHSTQRRLVCNNRSASGTCRLIGEPIDETATGDYLRPVLLNCTPPPTYFRHTAQAMRSDGTTLGAEPNTSSTPGYLGDWDGSPTSPSADKWRGYDPDVMTSGVKNKEWVIDRACLYRVEVWLYHTSGSEPRGQLSLWVNGAPDLAIQYEWKQPEGLITLHAFARSTEHLAVRFKASDYTTGSPVNTNATATVQITQSTDIWKAQEGFTPGIS